MPRLLLIATLLQSGFHCLNAFQAQAPAACLDRPLAERAYSRVRLLDVVKSQTPVRAEFLIRACGVRIVFNAELENDLREAGAENNVIAAVREIAPKPVVEKKPEDYPVAMFASRGVSATRIYIGWKGRLQSSDDDGKSWSLMSPFVSGIDSIDGSADGQRLFLGTPNGVWKTADAGNTWIVVGLSSQGRIASILVRPDDRDTVFASTTKSVFRTLDGGKTWKRVLYFSEDVHTCGLGYESSSKALYAGRCGAATEAGVDKSTDLGETWRRLPLSFPTLAMTIVTARTEVFAAIEKEKECGLYRLESAAESWSKVHNSDRGARPAASVGDPVNIYVGSNHTFWRSENFGMNWAKSCDAPLFGDRLSVVVDRMNKDRVLFLADNQVALSLDGGTTCRTIRPLDPLPR
jgi:photosystem II stability/assembly factor-like uncharacterized protein